MGNAKIPSTLFNRGAIGLDTFENLAVRRGAVDWLVRRFTHTAGGPDQKRRKRGR